MITINGYKKRNIYPQEGIWNYSASIAVDNITGYTTFGFSGNNGVQQFSLNSGRLFYDNSNIYLDSYSANNPFNLSGTISSGTHDVFINSNVKFLGEAKSTGYLNYFYIDSQNTTATLDLQIYGDRPDYSYDPFESYLSGQNISIQIVNSGSYPFKIFSGSLLSNSDNFALSGASNKSITGIGYIYLNTLSFVAGAQTVPILLNTNFGDIKLDFVASGQDISTLEFYLLFGPDTTVLSDGQPASYTINYRSNTGMYLTVSLEHVSGASGEYRSLVQQTGFIYGDVSGEIVGSGDLKGLHTGTIFLDNPLTGIETGLGSGLLSKFQYATGNILYSFDISLTGLGSGLIPVNIPATGTGIIEFNGIIGANGGTLTATGISGLGSGLLYDGSLINGIIQNGFASIFAPYTGSREITGNFSPSQYEQVSFITPVFFATGFINDFVGISGLAFATGRRVSGRLQGEFGFNFEPGIYTFSLFASGLGSGQSSILTGFNPISLNQVTSGTTGIITGNFGTGIYTDGCDWNDITLPFVATPSAIFNAQGVRVYPIIIDYLRPSNTGEYIYENSAALLSGRTGIRTNISRLGQTISGSGYFNNIFQKPFFTGDASYVLPDMIGWSEYLTGYTTTIQNYNPLPVIKKLQSVVNISSGDMMMPTGAESGVMTFTVTGNSSTFKKFIFRSAPSDPGFFTVLKLWRVNTQTLISSGSGLPFSTNDYNTAIALGGGLPDGGCMITPTLGTGNYLLSTEICPRIINGIIDTGNVYTEVGFTQSGFSGCESWENVAFTIYRSGLNPTGYTLNPISPAIWGTITVTPSGTKNYPKCIPTGFNSIYDASGFFVYNFYMRPTDTGCSFVIPVYNDNLLESPAIFRAELEISSPTGVSYGIQTSYITIYDDEDCCSDVTGFCSVIPSLPSIFNYPSDNPPSNEDPNPIMLPNPNPIGLGAGAGGGGGGVPPSPPPSPNVVNYSPPGTFNLSLGVVCGTDGKLQISAQTSVNGGGGPQYFIKYRFGGRDTGGGILFQPGNSPETILNYIPDFPFKAGEIYHVTAQIDAIGGVDQFAGYQKDGKPIVKKVPFSTTIIGSFMAPDCGGSCIQVQISTENVMFTYKYDDEFFGPQTIMWKMDNLNVLAPLVGSIYTYGQINVPAGTYEDPYFGTVNLTVLVYIQVVPSTSVMAISFNPYYGVSSFAAGWANNGMGRPSPLTAILIDPLLIPTPTQVTFNAGGAAINGFTIEAGNTTVNIVRGVNC